jgi:dTDP-4-amino-4,6-dideoxy-D-galactose acyltransferase
MTSDSYSLLAFDTDLFGFPVAEARVRAECLSATLPAAAGEGVRLVYWRCAVDDEAAAARAVALGGREVDTRLQYRRVVTASDDTGADPEIAIYPRPVPSDELRALAYESGRVSRFKVDAYVSPEVFTRLYDLWLERSCTGVLADRVIVYPDAEAPRAFTSVRSRGAIAEVGLVAVHRDLRGRGIGRRLVAQTIAYAAAKGASAIDVVTQGANVEARALYERSGFVLHEALRTFHFWL